MVKSLSWSTIEDDYHCTPSREESQRSLLRGRALALNPLTANGLLGQIRYILNAY